MRFEYLYKVLKRIEDRAEMYLGERDLFRLELFIEGYYAALRDTGVIPRALERGADADGTFAAYLRDRFGWSMSTGPMSAIRRECGSDAWNRFFELLKEFRRARATRAPKKRARAKKK
jgi:hypothetical protein